MIHTSAGGLAIDEPRCSVAAKTWPLDAASSIEYSGVYISRESCPTQKTMKKLLGLSLLDQVRQFKQLPEENGRFQRLVAELTLDQMML